MIKITVIGNLGGDPEVRYTQDQKAVCTLSIAGAKQGDVTSWVRVSLWEKQAENAAKYLKKGSKVYVEGVYSPDKATGNPRIWQGKDGQNNASLEISGRVVEYLSKVEAAAPEADGDAPF